jgi:hypothetical protein
MTRAVVSMRMGHDTGIPAHGSRHRPRLPSSGTVLVSKTCETCQEGERLVHARDEALLAAWSPGFLGRVLTTTGLYSMKERSLHAAHTPNSHCGR